MARKRKAQSPTQRQYYQQRRRIQNLASRARKRGYIVPEEYLPAIPKKITQASVRRLKNITPKSFYDKIDFLDQTTGEVMSGRAGRRQEREESARKAVETRIKRKAEEDERRRQEYFERERRKQDAIDRENMTRPEYSKQFDKGLLMKQKVEETLDNLRASFGISVAELTDLIRFQESEEQYFWYRLADNPEILDEMENIFYESEGVVHISVSAFTKVKSIIMQRPLSAQELRDTEDSYELDQAQGYKEFDPEDEDIEQYDEDEDSDIW